MFHVILCEHKMLKHTVSPCAGGIFGRTLPFSKIGSSLSPPLTITHIFHFLPRYHFQILNPIFWNEIAYRDVTVNHTIIPSEYITITEYARNCLPFVGYRCYGLGRNFKGKRVNKRKRGGVRIWVWD